MELTHEEVKNLFDYHDNGYLIWKIKSIGRIKQGKRAGWLSHKDDWDSYCISIKGKTYSTARIIFFWHKGYLPKIVDHIDRNPLNEKIENLREATKTQNNCNKNSAKNSSSKYLGVSYHKLGGKWTAQVTVNYKKIHLGYFANENDAALAYNEAAKKYYGEFANINII